MRSVRKNLPRLTLVVMLALSCVSVLAATKSVSAASSTTRTLNFDNTAWHYDSTNNVYWQIGIVYVTNPATTDYESLGIYVLVPI